MTTAAELDPASVQKLESELDPEMRFRPLLPGAAMFVAVQIVCTKKGCGRETVSPKPS